MDTLKQQLEALSTQERAYVYARSKVSSDAQAARDINLGRSAVSKWSNKDYLNDLANQLQYNRFVEAEMMLQDKLNDALERVFDLSASADRDSVSLQASKMIIDRVLGPVASKVKVEVEGLDELAELSRDMGVPLKDIIKATIEIMRSADGGDTDSE